MALSFSGAIGTWDVSNVINMWGMFDRLCPIRQDLDNWNTSSVKSMTNMFLGNDLFDVKNIDKWNVSNVRRMSGMFEHTLFNQNIGIWDISQVTDMEQMFDCSLFNQDISSWDVSNIVDMNRMFFEAESFSQNLCPWLGCIDRSVDVESMFEDSNCPNRDDPDLPDGPMCFNCE